MREKAMGSMGMSTAQVSSNTRTGDAPLGEINFWDARKDGFLVPVSLSGDISFPQMRKVIVVVVVRYPPVTADGSVPWVVLVKWSFAEKRPL